MVITPSMRVRQLSTGIALLFIFAFSSSSRAFCQTVYQAPRLVPMVVGSLGVGVKATGSTTSTLDFSASTKYEYSLDQSLQMQTTSANGSNLTETVASKPEPNPGDAFTGILTGLTTGDPSAFMKSWGNMIGYAVQPTTDDYKTIYTLSNGTNQTQANTTKAAQDFITQVKNTTNATVTYDINGGYIQLAIRITNIGSQGVTLVNPTFALYFVAADHSLTQEGIARAYQNAAASVENLYVPSDGGSTDLTFRLDGLNYQTLFNQYASAVGFSLVFQSPQIMDGGTATALSAKLDAEALQGVHVRILSDSYDTEAYVSTAASGAPIASLLTSLALSATYPPNAPDLTLAIQSVSPDNNVAADKDPATLTGSALISWRRWVLVHKNTYDLVTPVAATDAILPGESIYLLQVTAKDVLGAQYQPVIYSAKATPLVDGGELVLVNLPLQVGDVIKLSNLQIAEAKQDQVTFLTRPVKSGFGYPPNVPIGGHYGEMWMNIVPPPFAPLLPSFPLAYLSVGDPVIVYEPLTVMSIPIASMVSYFGLVDNYNLPTGFPLNEYASYVYVDIRLMYDLRLESAPGGMFTPSNGFLNIDWTDSQQVLDAIHSATWSYVITATTDLSSNKWSFKEIPQTYVPFLITDSSAFSQPDPGSATFAVNASFPVTIFVGSVTASNYNHVCAFGGITDPSLCSRFSVPSPVIFGPMGITHPSLVGSPSLFTFNADVDLIRLGGR